MALILTVEQADTYFSTRLHADKWDEIDASGDAEKTKALTTAQNQLELYYDLDSSVAVHKNAVCEQALFLLIGGAGAEKRTLLTTQGVIEQNIIEEKYKPNASEDFPICPYAKTALADVLKKSKATSVFLLYITRDDTDYVQ